MLGLLCLCCLRFTRRCLDGVWKVIYFLKTHHMHTHAWVPMCTCAHTCMHACTHACMHTCTHAVTVYMKWPVKCNGVACENPHPKFHVWYSMIRNTGSTPRWYDAVNLWRCDELPVSCTVLHTCRAVPLYQPNGVASLFVPTIYHHKNNSMMCAS